MMGDDGAAALLAQMCAAHPQGEWVVIDGGSAPENDVVAIRELHPDRLLIVDATDMGLNPGETRLIDPDDIAEMFIDDHPQYAAELSGRSVLKTTWVRYRFWAFSRTSLGFIIR